MSDMNHQRMVAKYKRKISDKLLRLREIDPYAQMMIDGEMNAYSKINPYSHMVINYPMSPKVRNRRPQQLIPNINKPKLRRLKKLLPKAFTNRNGCVSIHSDFQKLNQNLTSFYQSE